MNPNELSGLELLRHVVNGDLPHPTMADTIPMKMVSIEKGSAVFEAVAGPNHLNPMGGVHGGFAATVLDSVTGCAVHTMLEPGESYGTVDLNVKMLKPVPVGKTLRAHGTVINMSKRLGISQALLTDDEGTIYAHATCTCMINRKEQAQAPEAGTSIADIAFNAAQAMAAAKDKVIDLMRRPADHDSYLDVFETLKVA